MVKEFPETSFELRVCVSVARRLLDPLVEFTALASNDREFLGYFLHPAQKCLPNKNTLLKNLHRTLFECVAKVGVDINECMRSAWYSYSMNFVPGLGVRKGPALIRSLQMRVPQVDSREQLKNHGGLGETVFRNAAGFLKIVKESERADMLAGTRIHPDDYAIARKIAEDGCFDSEQARSSPDEAVRYIFRNSANLNQLDLQTFAKLLEDRGYGKKFQILQLIKSEFTAPFADPRPEWQPLPQAEVFNLLTNESDETLCEGMLVVVSVSHFVRDFRPEQDLHDAATSEARAKGAVCRLTDTDAGITGFLPAPSVSDRTDVKIDSILKVGQIVPARIAKIDREKFSIILSTKSSVLNDEKWNTPPKGFDICYDFEADRTEESLRKAKLEAERKEKKQQQLYQRQITHEFWRNIDHSKAEEELRGRPIGDYLFRPCSRGRNYISLSWKFDEDQIVHVEITEENKPSPLALGTKLKIKNLVYHDLDEIASRFDMRRSIIDQYQQKNYRYLEPIVQFCEEMRQAEKYDAGTEEQISAQLLADFQANPVRIPYVIGNPRRDGTFEMLFVVRSKLRRCKIIVTPAGYQLLHSPPLTTPQRLIAWFKINYPKLLEAQARKRDEQTRPTRPQLQPQPPAADPYSNPSAQALAAPTQQQQQQQQTWGAPLQAPLVRAYAQPAPPAAQPPPMPYGMPPPPYPMVPPPAMRAPPPPPPGTMVPPGWPQPQSLPQYAQPDYMNPGYARPVQPPMPPPQPQTQVQWGMPQYGAPAQPPAGDWGAQSYNQPPAQPAPPPRPAGTWGAPVGAVAAKPRDPSPPPPPARNSGGGGGGGGGGWGDRPRRDDGPRRPRRDSPRRSPARSPPRSPPRRAPGQGTWGAPPSQVAPPRRDDDDDRDAGRSRGGNPWARPSAPASAPAPAPTPAPAPAPAAGATWGAAVWGQPAAAAQAPDWGTFKPSGSGAAAANDRRREDEDDDRPPVTRMTWGAR
eukprot:TRINITY_DN2840_c1_g1_i6.p1 TRINITY_DN2840_c1_g1~~TRINITY_DN2840_c1_g1_i6.p1  ORF type:complete len:976 (-),score=220.34 TRINITY_DN2840_c1_g1_i6:14-2941(-)